MLESNDGISVKDHLQHVFVGDQRKGRGHISGRRILGQGKDSRARDVFQQHGVLNEQDRNIVFGRAIAKQEV